jgi:hypothetical protein
MDMERPSEPEMAHVARSRRHYLAGVFAPSTGNLCLSEQTMVVCCAQPGNCFESYNGLEN